eukprot:CAMPEP_0183721576 /NCGR_PEP_ID=MMETSP0737-20130205/13809_1 /TAXON_ID=385413 /ORGANISM="Thalassiosira miniscula, Strain CCMP1093" /LENGTH=193 /DNA_ID=CAMNT_0025951613 /DNA_START=131 /DNA_END=712 /DNA_ORIENTATION=-
MPHTTTKKTRTKRPDFRPNGKRRLKSQQAAAEKDRLARVAARESRNKLLTVPRHEALPSLPPSSTSGDDDANAINKMRRFQPLKQEQQQSHSPETIRFRALLKLLRQIVALDKQQQSGKTLNEAQLKKLGRYDSVVNELEELQRRLEQEEDEEEDESESGDGERDGESEDDDEGEEKVKEQNNEESDVETTEK